MLTSLDDLFTTQQERDEAGMEKVMLLPLSELRPFKDHPFKIQNDEEMERIVESIRKVGVLSPGLARPTIAHSKNNSQIGRIRALAVQCR